jgi:hypothetical protein
LKFAATSLTRFRPRSQTIKWGDKEHTITVHDLIQVNPNETIDNPDLLREASLLPWIADLAKGDVIELAIQMETELESMGLPDMDSDTGRFYGAPIKRIDAPIKYGRVVADAFKDTRDMQYTFLCRIDDSRFLEIQRMTGAYQGENPVNRNQLLDAWHLWCAEYNSCDYFLSLDFGLARIVGQSKKPATVPIVKPLELLDALDRRGD